MVTAVIFALTAAVSLAQFAVPNLLADLERTPAELHGQPWRVVTSLFVQDSGVLGTVSNLVFLAVIGSAAEQVLSRPRWLLHYFGVGAAAELIGYFWQPVGGGNSIAICGLTGAVALALWRRGVRAPGFAADAVLLWCGALLGTMSAALYIPGIIAGVVAVRLAGSARRRGIAVERQVAVATAMLTVVLIAIQNIHGAALAVGIAFAAFTFTSQPLVRE